MNQKEAKEIISKWHSSSRSEKARDWDKVLPYINKYPQIYEKGKKRNEKKKVKT